MTDDKGESQGQIDTTSTRNNTSCSFAMGRGEVTESVKVRTACRRCSTQRTGQEKEFKG